MNSGQIELICFDHSGPIWDTETPGGDYMPDPFKQFFRDNALCARYVGIYDPNNHPDPIGLPIGCHEIVPLLPSGKLPLPWEFVSREDLDATQSRALHISQALCPHCPLQAYKLGELFTTDPYYRKRTSDRPDLLFCQKPGMTPVDEFPSYGILKFAWERK